MTVTWPPVAAQHTATMPVGRYPGFRRLFAPGELTLGLIMSLETYPDTPAPMMLRRRPYADLMADLAADVLPVFPSLKQGEDTPA